MAYVAHQKRLKTCNMDLPLDLAPKTTPLARNWGACLSVGCGEFFFVVLQYLIIRLDLLCHKFAPLLQEDVIVLNVPIQ